MKSYTDMLSYDSFEKRFEYLKLNGSPYDRTFGDDRWINQKFYKSREWLILRNKIIARDYGCDLAVFGYDILDTIYIHHINPISIEDFTDNNNKLLDENNLVCVSFNTHNAIHFGTSDILQKTGIAERIPNDTKVW